VATLFSPVELIRACLAAGLFWMSLYVIFAVIYHLLKVHERFGIFRTPEPDVHFRTLLQNWKVPLLWGVGFVLARSLFGLEVDGGLKLVFVVPKEFVWLSSPNLLTDLLYAIGAFYATDFVDYWMHRLHHRHDLLYSKFPFGHFVHHNCVYLNPMAVQSSPLVHLTAVGGFAMYALLLSQGLWLAAALVYTARGISNFGSHLGCDPLPGRSRLNHRVGGWIPWIPLHHQYHHLPYVKEGNYGNFTCLWDYVFGTVVPESVYHLEQGEPLPRVMERMRSGDAVMEKFLKGKTAWNLH
jgi:sterol desaturase/sphingolipid hydroxylase (fatty acid hydroxylase superfamily)